MFCDFKTFHLEIANLKTILRKNNYHLNFIDSSIKLFFKKLSKPKIIVQNVPKRDVFPNLLFLEINSFQMWKKLQKLYIHTMRYGNLKLVFKSPVRIKSFFTFNDKLPKMLISWLFYKWKCGGCNATFYGKIKHHFKVQICEHLDISHLTRKKVKIDNNNLIVIQENLLCYNYSPSFENFSILTRESNNFKLKIIENLLIVHDKPVLNKAHSSLSLRLFLYHISGYHIFYHITWCLSISLYVCYCHLFSFQYHLTNFSIL